MAENNKKGSTKKSPKKRSNTAAKLRQERDEAKNQLEHCHEELEECREELRYALRVMESLKEKAIEKTTDHSKNVPSIPASAFMIRSYFRSDDELKGNITHLFTGDMKAFSGYDAETIIEFMKQYPPQEIAETTEVVENFEDSERSKRQTKTDEKEKSPTNVEQKTQDGAKKKKSPPGKKRPTTLPAIEQGLSTLGDVVQLIQQSEILVFPDDSDKSANIVSSLKPFSVQVNINAPQHRELQASYPSADLTARRLDDRSIHPLGREELFVDREDYLYSRIDGVTLEPGMYRIEVGLAADANSELPVLLPVSQESDLLMVTD